MTTVFLNLEEFKNSSNPQDILLDREGQVWRYEQEFFGKVLKPVGEFDGGCESISSSPAFVPFIEKKIPFIFLQQIVRFFVDVDAQCFGSEAMIQIFFDKKSQEYVLYSPTQSVTATLVSYKQNVDYTSNPDYIYVMDIHSHNTMSAFFSGTDDANEQETRLYGVVGRVDKVTPDILLRSSMEGMFTMLPLDVIFDIPAHYSLDNLPFPKVDYPDEWMKSIQNSSRFGYSHYLDDFGGFHNTPDSFGSHYDIPDNFGDFLNFSDDFDGNLETFKEKLKGKLEGGPISPQPLSSNKKGRSLMDKALSKFKKSTKGLKRSRRGLNNSPASSAEVVTQPYWLDESIRQSVDTSDKSTGLTDFSFKGESPFNPYLSVNNDFIVNELFKKYAQRLHVLKDNHNTDGYASYHILEHDKNEKVVELNGPYFSDEILNALIERIVSLSAAESVECNPSLDTAEVEDYFYDFFEESEFVKHVAFRVNSPIEDLAFEFLNAVKADKSLSGIPERFNLMLSNSTFVLNEVMLSSDHSTPVPIGYELEFNALSGKKTFISYFNCKHSALEEIEEMVETFLCISCSDKYRHRSNKYFIETFSSQLMSSISSNVSKRRVTGFTNRDYADVKHVNFSYSYHQFIKTLN